MPKPIIICDRGLLAGTWSRDPWTKSWHFADISAFSCYPTKNLGGTGDGGVILCRSKEFAEKIKSLRQYGWNKERESIISGFNSRLDELQAAILRVKLHHLANDNAKRRAIALRYNEAFKDLPITLPALVEN